MGVGIAIDVSITTTARFRDEQLSWKTWTVPITITHVIFPAIGYYLFWGAEKVAPAAETILGIAGFILVLLFLYEVISESSGSTPIFGISSFISKVKIFRIKNEDGRRFIAILAVSGDALWSGPAKAAQASASNWSDTEVFVSFFVAGITVAAIAQLALLAAYLLRSVRFKDTDKMVYFNLVAKWLELSVIGGFGILSLWHGLSDDGNLYTSIFIASSILAVIFLSLFVELREHERESAEEAVGNT